VTPDWSEAHRGNLEIWSKGIRQTQTTVASKFNRLGVMAAHQNSWHSVSKVQTTRDRCCVSNYYFSNNPCWLQILFTGLLLEIGPQKK
jgi:Rps23 Pro-64 3,4-dihydroxylase Tpa1-like proline 4-hydroxylase